MNPFDITVLSSEVAYIVLGKIMLADQGDKYRALKLVSEVPDP